MEIHKPKAAHSWREFAIEIGTIICGILIALGLEQTIEWLHWRHKVEQTSEALRLELTDDDGPQAFQRMAVWPCLERQLQAVTHAVDARATRSEVVALTSAYQPPAVSWDSEAWRVALASDVGSHTSAETMIVWSSPYRLIPRLSDTNRRESETLERLQLAGGAAQLSQSERERLSEVVLALRRENTSMARISRAFLRALHDAKLDMTDAAQRKALAQLRGRFGACVTTPSYITYDPYGTISPWAPL